MDNTSEARRKKIMRRKRAMLKRTHRRINVTFTWCKDIYD